MRQNKNYMSENYKQDKKLKICDNKGLWPWHLGFITLAAALPTLGFESLHLKTSQAPKYEQSHCTSATPCDTYNKRKKGFKK